MYRVYDTFEECCYDTKEAEKVKKENPTAPPERWLFVVVHDDMPDDIVYEDLVVVRPCSNSELRVASITGNKKTIESLLGCQIG